MRECLTAWLEYNVRLDIKSIEVNLKVKYLHCYIDQNIKLG